MSRKFIPMSLVVPFLKTEEDYKTVLSEATAASQAVEDLRRRLDEALQTEVFLQHKLQMTTVSMQQATKALNDWAESTRADFRVILEDVQGYLVRGSEAGLLMELIPILSATVLKGLLPVLRDNDTSGHAERIYEAGIRMFREGRTPRTRPELYREAGYQKKDLRAPVYKFVAPPSIRKAQPTTRWLKYDITPSCASSWSLADLKRTFEILQKVQSGTLSADQVPLFGNLKLDDPTNWDALVAVAEWLKLTE
ncbi:MAG TPA: hypothetical protein VNG90_03170 [Candidatus Acidoferrum sp.]|nr:hypothetical protein [Candidatus Acidoferrum sp.]